jgi:RHS repeat-associated protein
MKRKRTRPALWLGTLIATAAAIRPAAAQEPDSDPSALDAPPSASETSDQERTQESGRAAPSALGPKASPKHDASPNGQSDGKAAQSAQGESTRRSAASDSTQPVVLPGGADKTGVSSQAISIPQGAGKIEGMGESFSTQLSTGTATFGVPFALPAARGVAQPSLSLSYSSSAGQGVAGMGWTVPVGFIARQTDRGIPRYDDAPGWHPGMDHFVFNGGQELVPICVVEADLSCLGGSPVNAPVPEEMPSWSAGWRYFRPRVEGGFSRFFWSADGKTWRVQEKSGLVMELGVAPADPGYTGALEVDPSNAGKIFRWNLVREYDQHVDAQGRAVNVVAFRYETVDGVAYLADIFDTPPAANAGTAPLAAYAHRTHLRYETRPDAAWSYRRGWATRMSRRLVGVDVTSKPFEDAGAPRQLLRRYHVEYDATYHVSLLSAVQVEGRCSQPIPEASLASETTCPRLPAMTFEYQHVTPFDTSGNQGVADLDGYEGFDERITTMSSSPDYSLEDDQTDLFDINADALPDVLVTKPALFGNKHGVFFNGAAGVADTFAQGSIGVAGVLGADVQTIKLSNINVRAHDLDGDAIIDLLHMPAVKTYAVYTPTRVAGAWQWTGRAVTTASQQSPQIDFGGDGFEVRVLDVNGDGLVDVVHSAGTQLKTFLSLGRYPGGDGQFGHASWTGPTTATISNEPVTACLPWAGLPVQFSDPEIKLGDMNGDGLPDIVRVRKNDVRYWPGRGNGFWGTGALDDCLGGTFGAGRDIAMTASPPYSDINGDSLRLDDVNGDGLDDLVQVRFDDVDVWLNVDGASWTDRHIIEGTPASPSYANRVRLVDVNGSGTRDILWGDGNNYRYIDVSGATRPWVLTHVDNGLGKTTELEYESSAQLMLAAAKAGAAWTTMAPIPVHVVTKVTERDNLPLAGQPAGEYVTEYGYRDPRYDGLQREFRGFRQATTKRLGDANSPSSVAVSSFQLGDCKGACTPADRWKDNAREALKGLPITTESFDAETSAYLSTTHNTYTLRKLYSGLDGRSVHHAFVSATDVFLYDVFSFVKAESDVLLDEVVVDSEATTEQGKVRLRSDMGRVATHVSTVVDAFGNVTHQIAAGCVEGCASGVDDEVITTVSAPDRPAGDETGWLWRTVHTHVEGSDHGNVPRNSTIIEYDALGRPIETTAELAGTLLLDRTHEDPLAAFSEDPPSSASIDGVVWLSSTAYDDFGNVTEARGAGGRCRLLGYDAPYASLPVVETVLAGPLGLEGCGTIELTTSVPAYDRGLAVALEVEDLHGELTKAYFDGFGRPVELWRPSPTILGQVSPLPSMKIEYLPGQPYSRIHTETHDGVALTDADYHHTWAYVDGFGRTVATLSEADPSAEDGGAWIVDGVRDRDAKGAPRRAYLPWFYDGDPAAFPIAAEPPTNYTRDRYDAFERQIMHYGFHLGPTLETRHHALSQDLWDAADIGPSDHQGTFATHRSDGHGRSVVVTERARVGIPVEERHTTTRYLPTGEPEVITRHRGSDSVVRWMRYDTLGRRVLNAEPHTTKDFDPDPSTNPDSMSAWRYAYDDAGELVGTSDARGCGVNYHYDAAGRVVAEDYSPCLVSHAAYSAPNFAGRAGIEVLYHYDSPDPDAPAGFENDDVLLGRLASVSDRASRTLSRFDGRGRVTGIARQVAKPGIPSDAVSNRYASHWYSRFARFDAADRPIQESTGAEHPDVLGVDVEDNGEFPAHAARSTVETKYSGRGTVKQLGGSYLALVARIERSADGLVDEIEYGDLAKTTTAFGYDMRRRLLSIQTYRGPPNLPYEWTASPPPVDYVPPPDYGGSPSSFQLLLQDEVFEYDLVDNPKEIRDWRIASEWPAGAKPVTRNVTYDDLYRIAEINYDYVAGDDNWVSPFEAENATAPADLDPRRGLPSPHVSFDKRVLSQTFEYDWLGNTTLTDDDAHGFYDRSIGQATHDIQGGKPYQLSAASNHAIPGGGTRKGTLAAIYDDCGNLTRVVIEREGTCVPTANCSQKFKYEWDEIGHLVRARRWDFPYQGTAPDDNDPPAADVSYAYDLNDQRVLKTATDATTSLHTLYVFPTFELRRAGWSAATGEYQRTSASGEVLEVPYLTSQGERIARVAYEAPADQVPMYGESNQHIFFELADHLGSTSIVLDKRTGELVQRTTFQAYGATESDYRPERWKGFREDYRFTGKEDEIDLGLIYFGARFYMPSTGRWISADPLTIHSLGADLNAYAYVRGKALATVDPLGLSEPGETGFSEAHKARSEALAIHILPGVKDAAREEVSTAVRGLAALARLAGDDPVKAVQVVAEAVVDAPEAIAKDIASEANAIKRSKTLREAVKHGTKMAVRVGDAVNLSKLGARAGKKAGQAAVRGLGAAEARLKQLMGPVAARLHKNFTVGAANAKLYGQATVVVVENGGAGRKLIATANQEVYQDLKKLADDGKLAPGEELLDFVDRSKGGVDAPHPDTFAYDVARERGFVDPSAASTPLTCKDCQKAAATKPKIRVETPGKPK